MSTKEVPLIFAWAIMVITLLMVLGIPNRAPRTALLSTRDAEVNERPMSRDEHIDLHDYYDADSVSLSHDQALDSVIAMLRGRSYGSMRHGLYRFRPGDLEDLFAGSPPPASITSTERKREIRHLWRDWATIESQPASLEDDSGLMERIAWLLLLGQGALYVAYSMWRGGVPWLALALFAVTAFSVIWTAKEEVGYRLFVDNSSPYTVTVWIGTDSAFTLLPHRHAVTRLGRTVQTIEARTPFGLFERLKIPKEGVPTESALGNALRGDWTIVYSVLGHNRYHDQKTEYLAR